MALPIVVATVVLFAVSPLIAPNSLHGTALNSMLPFAAILAFASLGQMLVMQQGGLDLSVAGAVSLGAVVVTQLPSGQASMAPLAIVLAVACTTLAGLVNGLIVQWLRVTPIVETLGMNALLYGFIYWYTGGQLNSGVPKLFVRFVSGRTIGVPNTILIAIALLVGVTLVLRLTVAGRRFELIGASEVAARAAGLPVGRYRIGTYCAAGALYGVAGVLLAGYTQTPALNAGDEYLLPTIVAVVLGGTMLGSGRGSAVGTAVGALFFEQLIQILVTLGSPQSAQYLIEAVIVVLGIAVRSIHRRGVPGRPVDSPPVRRWSLRRRSRDRLLAGPAAQLLVPPHRRSRHTDRSQPKSTNDWSVR